MSKVQQERGFGSLPSSTETNPRDHVKSISTNIEADTTPIRCIGSPQYTVSTKQNKIRRDQVDDLMPTVEEGEVIDKPMIDIIKTKNNESFGEYPSFCDFDRKIHIDCAYNLRFSCMIVVENMDGYRDQDMRDIIFGSHSAKFHMGKQEGLTD
nr:hypothetical protein [Tanacetum cinerariifolium]GEZ12405.1 hypothetical protein [Tanacetum cinerariifolium]